MSLRVAIGQEYFSKINIFITVSIQFSKHSGLFGFMLQTTTLRSQMSCSLVYLPIAMILFLWGPSLILSNVFHCGIAIPVLALKVFIFAGCI